MNFNKKTKVIIYFSLVFLGLTFHIWREINLSNTAFLEDDLFIVESGWSLFDTSEALEESNLIKSKELFNICVLFSGSQKGLQAGTYNLNPSMSIANIAQKIITGKTVKQEITIPEGWNLRDIGWYLENKGMFQAEELFELVGFPAIDYSKTSDLPELKDFSSDYDFLTTKPQNLSLEGYLFPDTYEIEKDSSLEVIVKKMLLNFNTKLNQELRGEIEKQRKTIFDIIVMASLLEKEVRGIEDKKIISGILWKRLENYFPLQVDATIAYITSKKTTQISITETKTESPYNTYKYLGLPVGPICNPGIESIEAAIYPESNEYWYYLSTPEGETIFSKTLLDHNIAKAKYLK